MWAGPEVHPTKALVTSAVSAGIPVVNQLLVGAGINPGTYIAAVSGSSPAYTLTLSQNATVANGTTIRSPSNGGGNYIGAANPTQAITNFVRESETIPATGAMDRWTTLEEVAGSINSQRDFPPENMSFSTRAALIGRPMLARHLPGLDILLPVRTVFS